MGDHVQTKNMLKNIYTENNKKALEPTITILNQLLDGEITISEIQANDSLEEMIRNGVTVLYSQILTIRKVDPHYDPRL
ncbi:hypothetical protein VCSRO121_3460 [Vibrio cholerae]|nr:hypothetical protein VCSRO121_3460 [Vibrio cholerae]